jgi:hypothetical protein
MPQYSNLLRLGHWSNRVLIESISESPLIWMDLIISKLSVILILLKSIMQDKKLIAVVLASRIEHNSVKSSFSIVPYRVTVSKVGIAWSSFRGERQPSFIPPLFIILAKKKCCLSSVILLRDTCQRTKWILVVGSLSWIKETSIGKLRKSLFSRTMI